MAAKSSGIVKKIAKERIERLYALAEETYNEDPKLANRYVKLIGQISRHYRIKPGPVIKNHICRKCGSLLIPGSNLKVRLVSGRKYLLYKCMNCNAERKVFYKKQTR